MAFYFDGSFALVSSWVFWISKGSLPHSNSKHNHFSVPAQSCFSLVVVFEACETPSLCRDCRSLSKSYNMLESVYQTRMKNSGWNVSTWEVKTRNRNLRPTSVKRNPKPQRSLGTRKLNQQWCPFTVGCLKGFHSNLEVISEPSLETSL